MSSYSESLRLLLGLEKFGMKFGLEGVSRLLGVLGDPHLRFPSIHVAGTNGKGSTASMLAAMFTSAGYRTGLYTSPHLVSFTERMRIDGTPISPRNVAELVQRLRSRIVRLKPTFFEATTAIALGWFAEQEVDVAVIETGLGGRLDSTNVVRPFLTVITNIGLEHTEILGNTIEEIAKEKAGIIKKGIPCITGVEDHRALDVLKSICQQKRASLNVLRGLKVSVRKETLTGSVVDLRFNASRYEDLRISLPGRFQFQNAALALAAIEEVNRLGHFRLPERSMRMGLGKIQGLTGLQGRLSLWQRRPQLILDVAHNPDGVRHLVAALKHLGVEDLILVFGVMKDKDHVAMVRALEPLVQEVIAVAARSERSRSASDVAASFSRRGIGVRAALSVREGVRLALDRASAGTQILVTGSHYVVGEAMESLSEKKGLTIRR